LAFHYNADRTYAIDSLASVHSLLASSGDDACDGNRGKKTEHHAGSDLSLPLLSLLTLLPKAAAKSAEAASTTEAAKASAEAAQPAAEADQPAAAATRAAVGHGVQASLRRTRANHARFRCAAARESACVRIETATQRRAACALDVRVGL